MRLVSLVAAIFSGLLLFSLITLGQTTYQKPNGYLGVWLSDVTDDRAAALKLPDAHGAEIKHVNEGSPAEKAGLRAGDVILTYNGEYILGREQLGRLVRETPLDRKVKLQLWRNEKKQTVSVNLAASAVNTQNPATSTSYPDAGMSSVPVDFPHALIVWTNVALGFEYEPLEAPLAQYFGVRGGVLIRAVAIGSPAEKAGLHAGDVITGIGTREIAAPNDLVSYLRSQQQPIRSLEIQYCRDHKRRTASMPIE